jgi:hypothetical protein
MELEQEQVSTQAYGIFINKYTNQKIYKYLCEQVEKQKATILVFFINNKILNIGCIKNTNLDDELFVYYKKDLIDQYVSSCKPYKYEIDILTQYEKKSFQAFILYLSEINTENIYNIPKYYVYYYNDYYND